MSLTTAYAHSLHPSLLFFQVLFYAYVCTYIHVCAPRTNLHKPEKGDSLELATDDNEWMLGAEIRSSFKEASTLDPSHLPSTQHSPSFLENCLVDSNSQQSCLNFPSALVIDVYPETRLSSGLNAEVEKAQRTGNYSRSNELFQTVTNLKLSKAELILDWNLAIIAFLETSVYYRKHCWKYAAISLELDMATSPEFKYFIALTLPPLFICPRSLLLLLSFIGPGARAIYRP